MFVRPNAACVASVQGRTGRLGACAPPPAFSRLLPSSIAASRCLVSFFVSSRVGVCHPFNRALAKPFLAAGVALLVELAVRAIPMAPKARVALVVAAGLVVYPAAAFPEAAKHQGAALVIVNREPTHLDPLADVVINRSIGEALGRVVGID